MPLVFIFHHKQAPWTATACVGQMVRSFFYCVMCCVLVFRVLYIVQQELCIMYCLLCSV